jgi:hypothetical protein
MILLDEALQSRQTEYLSVSVGGAWALARQDLGVPSSLKLSKSGIAGRKEPNHRGAGSMRTRMREPRILGPVRSSLPSVSATLALDIKT